ncbi:hypothetical protein JKF63_06937 [Porcisia hertigi]|uniref:Uncharacterized protein n=1 Tax=Porcisia hertigi TaxID=2761500 RepID=A0A836LJD9_9TRYP|nr:hypothetical protein JKF63_06937 [Porcisia hertigi]
MKKSPSANSINLDGCCMASVAAQRESSPVTMMPMKTAMTRDTVNASISSLGLRSQSSTPLPNIELDKTTIELIRENEQMLLRIKTLEHELDKKQILLNHAEEERKNLACNVADLRNQLGMATSKATESSGKVINYETAYTELQYTFDKLKEDSDALKEKLEEATKRERMLMQSTHSTVQRQTQMLEAFDLVKDAMKMPNTLVVFIQDVMKKFNDPALRRADRQPKLKNDIDRIESLVAMYKPDMSASAAVSPDGVPNLDIPIRQGVYSLSHVITTLLKDAIRE